MVELLAEPQVLRAALVEAGGDDDAVDDHRPGRLVQRAIAAAELDGGVDPAARQRPTPAPAPPSTSAVDGRHRSHGAGRLEPTGIDVDGDDLGAGERGQAGGEQPDDPLAEDRDPVAEPGLGGQHRVERDRADAREAARDRVVTVETRPRTASAGTTASLR